MYFDRLSTNDKLKCTLHYFNHYFFLDLMLPTDLIGNISCPKGYD